MTSLKEPLNGIHLLPSDRRHTGSQVLILPSGDLSESAREQVEAHPNGEWIYSLRLKSIISAERRNEYLRQLRERGWVHVPFGEIEAPQRSDDSAA